ncbi:MAG: hypothetical protein KDA41_15815, partial [Planctomycetales bacterium]|nr:hypothetical protein [Planctomycetales bacterium]
AARLGVDSTFFSMQRGYIARQLGNAAEAERHFLAVLEKSPSHFEAMNQLALVLCQSDDADAQRRAMQLAQLNLRRFPTSSHALSTFGWVSFNVGRKKEAVDALQLAVTRADVRSETFYYYARVLWDLQRKDEARVVAERVKAAVDEPGLFVLRPEAKVWVATVL